MTLLLERRNAVIYGGGGSIGGAVARAFAREGATVHLAGRTRAKLDAVADAIRSAGGHAATAQLDALDEHAVDAHADSIATIDVSLCVISQQDVQGTPLVEMTVDDLMRPVDVTTRAMFITARAAARRMIRQRSGVILAFGGYGDPHPNLGGLQVAFQAAEALRRALSVELGPHGIRVVTLQTNGIPESISNPEFRERIEAGIAATTMLGRAASLEDVGNAAVFAASDWARTVTASKINISCGGFVD